MTQIARKAFDITDLETGERYSFGPGDEVEDEIVDLLEEDRRAKIFDEEEDEFLTEDGEMIVAQPNGNLAFDESEGEEGGEKALEDMTVPELRKYAAVNEISLGSASKKDDILARIQEVEDERADEGEEE